MAKLRINKPGSASSQGDCESTQNNSYVGAKKSLEAGPDFQKQSGNAFIAGQDASAGINVTPWNMLWLYNNSSSVAWVSLSTAAIGAAPSSYANGIPLPANAWTRLSSGENTNIRTSASTVGLYLVNDDTTVRDIDPNS